MTNSMELQKNPERLLCDTDTLEILSRQAAEFINSKIEYLREQLSPRKKEKLKASHNMYCLAESSYKRIEADFKVLIAAKEWDAIKHYYDELERVMADVPEGYVNERERNMAYDILSHVKEASEEFTNILNLTTKTEEAENSLEER